ncbi:MAG: hypothetical protein QM765_42330 [Myxococcales bacterium]
MRPLSGWPVGPLPCLVVGLLLLSGCHDFSVPAEHHGSVPISVACTSSEECESDLCANGVCCEHACAADELCNLSGHEGRCTQRPPGTPCAQAADCPGGHCLHTSTRSYCFEDDCAADERYDLPGHEGTCTPRPPGTLCGKAEECPGGRCIDSADGVTKFCCDRDCLQDELCDLPDHLGTCTPRPPGHPCVTTAQCPGGRCVDATDGTAKFCCDRDCLPDELCSLPDHLGTCTPRPPGFACLKAAECPGGRCVPSTDGKRAFCCDRTCSDQEACNLEGFEGTCTLRRPGDSCQADLECQTGHCVDQVCCTDSCEGDCRSCALPGQQGTCSDVPENQDPRARCGFCGACTRGFCGAALVNSSPKQECGDREVCSASQTCGLRTGELCSEDSGCATGACFLSRCVLVERELLYPRPIDPPVTELGLGGLAIDSRDAIAVGVASVHEYGTVPRRDPSQYATEVFGPSGWSRAATVDRIIDSTDRFLLSTMTYWGSRLYQAQYHPCSASTGCGLVGQLFGSELQPGAREQISAPDAVVSAAYLGADAGGNLWAAFSDRTISPYVIRVVQRQAQENSAPTWVERWSVEDPSTFGYRPLWGAQALEDGLYLVVLASETSGEVSAVVYGPSGVEVTRRLLPGPCDFEVPSTAWAVGSFGRGAARGLAIAANCYDDTYLLTWTPSEATPWWSGIVPAGSAIPVRNAEFPAFLLFEYDGRYDDLELYWKDTDWRKKRAFESKYAAAVRTADAAQAEDGTLAVSVSLYEYWKGAGTPSTMVQALRFHR